MSVAPHLELDALQFRQGFQLGPDHIEVADDDQGQLVERQVGLGEALICSGVTDRTEGT